MRTSGQRYDAPPRSAPPELLDRLQVTEDAPAHLAVVEESGSFARASCPGCGWSGPARRARAVAEADARSHS